MKTNLKKAVLLLLAASLALNFCACGKKTKNNTESNSNTLTYWVPLNPNAATSVSNYGETPFAKELQKRLGVTIEYTHPTQGSELEKFNLLVASENLPDIIEYTWVNYTGGPSKALADNIITALDIENKAPNLYAYIKETPEVEKMMKTDDGKYFCFPFIRGERSLQTSAGAIVRKDWLDDLGMDMPETIDEWEEMLKAFKTKKGAKYPMCYAPYYEIWGLFAGAWGIADGLYVDNGEVKYGALEDGYKEFLTNMADWYKKGYMPPDFSTMEQSLIDSYLINGDSGVMIGSVGSGIGRISDAAKEEGFLLAGAPYPTLKKGEKPQFGQMDNRVPGTYATITRDCKNVDLAMKVLDYGYSEEGRMLFNFGIEGESYEMKDGYPTYTDIITKNPDGLSMSGAMARYLQAYNAGPFIQDVRYMQQYAARDNQQEAIKTWSNTDMEKHLLPEISLLPKDTNAMAKKISAVNSYKDEMLVKFITGAESLDNYDKFVKGLKERGIDEYLKLMNEAYQRYEER